MKLKSKKRCIFKKSRNMRVNKREPLVATNLIGKLDLNDLVRDRIDYIGRLMLLLLLLLLLLLWLLLLRCCRLTCRRRTRRLTAARIHARIHYRCCCCRVAHICRRCGRR